LVPKEVNMVPTEGVPLAGRRRPTRNEGPYNRGGEKNEGRGREETALKYSNTNHLLRGRIYEEARRAPKKFSDSSVRMEGNVDGGKKNHPP